MTTWRGSYRAPGATPYYEDDLITLYRANALDLPLADNSVDLVVTSPPYFGLRSYQDGGEHYDGQIGAEATPTEFVDALIAATREMVRVTKPSGSIWVNLGDKYAGGGGYAPDAPSNVGNNRHGDGKGGARSVSNRGAAWGYRPKSLIGIPWRYAIRCIDDLGLILRAEVVWSKCLSGGTVVYARTKGRVQAIKLHDLCRHYQAEDVELWTGEKWSQVRAWEPTARGDAQYEIELRSGERIGTTAEHRWPTARGLVRSDDMQVGDVIDTAPLPDGTAHPAALDDEMVGWFVGLYIAEGSRSEQTIQFAGHVDEMVERFVRLSKIASAFHGTARVHETGGNTSTINVTGPALRALLELYVGGRTAKDKHLTPRVWQRSNTFLRAVLDGYLAGDGHWREDAHRWVLGFTNNDALASDLRTLGARLGLSVRLQRCTHTGFGKEWPGWRGNITDPHRRRRPDSEVVAVRASRARQFWDIEIEDEPHLFALASGVLTHNSNGLPESVTDRVRRSHEHWFHFTLNPRYYSAVDEVREAVGVSHARGKGQGDDSRGDNGVPIFRPNPLGKLPGSVWEIPTEPLRVPEELGIDHFAAFPTEFPRRIITGWSPRGVCVECGEGRRPVVERRPVPMSVKNPAGRSLGMRDASRGDAAMTCSGQEMARWKSANPDRITGESCDCPEPTAPTTPGVVLDPFSGTGTTALVASVLGRHGIGVDMSEDYCRLAAWRTTDPRQRARAARKPWTPPAEQLPGQEALDFGGVQ